MSLSDAFDESEEIVKASIFSEGMALLPDTAIVCFKKELIDAIDKEDIFKRVSSLLECGEEIPLYGTKVGEKEVIVYRTLIGGPATVLMMEELAARGVKNFIFFGSCGALTALTPGAFCLPQKAYRDEGTSYHYLPESDFVSVDTFQQTRDVFQENQIPCCAVNTWTTDAIYRETKELAQKRVEAGCQVVEMECASVMAASHKRGWNTYYFFYSEDTLAGQAWQMNELREEKKGILKVCLQIALKIAEKIPKERPVEERKEGNE